ncbi:DJ-1/PfpI family protein [Galbibacter sp. PAP.153]|uniref:DJ-1/PfpI family protein n=1 Tax=Galbibacter sp. PAP.153 TaxID=3104623 RepID=UPI0030096ABB
MKKVLMFLSQGVEDLEAVTIIDVLGWTNVRDNLTPVYLKTCAFHDSVKGKFGIDFKPTYNIKKEEPDYTQFDAFVLPGGFHNAGYDEAYSEHLHKIATIIHQNGGIIATMCVGVLPISDAGLLKEKKATTYNLSRFHDNVGRLEESGATYTGNKVEIDNNIISCAGPASSLEVAYLLLEKLTGKENTEKVKELMIY